MAQKWSPQQARLLGHVPERRPPVRSSAIVAEQGDPAVAGDEQVGPAVAVVVGDGGAVRVEPRLAADRVQPGLRRHVLELPAAEVPVEPAGVARDLLLVRPVETAAAGEEDVQQAVAVVVDQRRPRRRATPGWRSGRPPRRCGR